jgi:hypothetical protein
MGVTRYIGQLTLSRFRTRMVQVDIALNSCYTAYLELDYTSVFPSAIGSQRNGCDLIGYNVPFVSVSGTQYTKSRFADETAPASAAARFRG